MRVDVLLGEAQVMPADVADRAVVVIDVLRAATTVAVALDGGARAVIPFETVDETGSRARAYARGDGARLAEMVEQPFQGGIASLVLEAGYAKSLIAAEFERDVERCFTIDLYDRAVQYQHRQLQLDPLTGSER